ncbi:MAG: hypothetical protein AB7E47_05155 [Desulfovibrionaceae bacterium]
MQQKLVPTRVKSRLKGVLQLAVVLGVMWSFMQGGGPWLERHFTPLGDMAAFIDRTGIETNKFWYTDIAITREAELGARCSLRFPPAGPRQ